MCVCACTSACVYAMHGSTMNSDLLLGTVMTTATLSHHLRSNKHITVYEVVMSNNLDVYVKYLILALASQYG